MVKRSRPDSISSSSEADSPYIGPEGSSRAVSPISANDSAHSSKIAHLDASSASIEKPEVMKCLLPPHQPLSFSSYEDYDVHYQKNHVNRCSECHKNFPSDHYLGLHIAENHDSLNEARRARGEKTYACFVSDCDRLCSTPQKRRLHVIDKHQFPKYYDFFIVNDGLGKRNSMLRPGPGHRRRSSAATVATARQRASSSANATGNSDADPRNGTNADMEVDKPTINLVEEGVEAVASRGGALAGIDEKGKAKAVPPAVSDAAMEDITSSLSTLRFVPPSIKFGRGRGRGGLARS